MTMTPFLETQHYECIHDKLAHFTKHNLYDDSSARPFMSVYFAA